MAFKMKYNKKGFPFKEEFVGTQRVTTPNITIERPKFKPFSGYLEKNPKEKYLDLLVKFEPPSEPTPPENTPVVTI